MYSTQDQILVRHTYLVHVGHHPPGVTQLVLVVQVEVEELVVPLVVLHPPRCATVSM